MEFYVSQSATNVLAFRTVKTSSQFLVSSLCYSYLLFLQLQKICILL